MRPYGTPQSPTGRFTEGPDVLEIKEEGRASHVGKLRGRGGDYKPYTRNAASRRATRRTLNRRTRALARRDLRTQVEG